VNAIAARLQRWEWVPLTVVCAYLVYMLLDLFVPVLWVHGTLVSKSADSVVITMGGWKIRECRFHGVQAYSVDGEGRRRAATITRIDAPIVGLTHPRGHYDLGVWDIRPLHGGISVLVYAHHACSGADDLRMTKMAEVAVP